MMQFVKGTFLEAGVVPKGGLLRGAGTLRFACAMFCHVANLGRAKCCAKRNGVSACSKLLFRLVTPETWWLRSPPVPATTWCWRLRACRNKRRECNSIAGMPAGGHQDHRLWYWAWARRVPSAAVLQPTGNTVREHDRRDKIINTRQRGAERQVVMCASSWRS